VLASSLKSRAEVALAVADAVLRGSKPAGTVDIQANFSSSTQNRRFIR
jgi:hypothetical protein